MKIQESNAESQTASILQDRLGHMEQDVTGDTGAQKTNRIFSYFTLFMVVTVSVLLITGILGGFIYFKFIQFNREIAEVKLAVEYNFNMEKLGQETTKYWIRINRWQTKRDFQTILKPQTVSENTLTKIEIQPSQIKSEFSAAQSKLSFSAKLYLNWHMQNHKMDQIDYFRLNSSYNLDALVEERRICILAPFKNLLSFGAENSSVHLFMKSINAQNYSNYYVYLIDDASTDNSSDLIMKQIPKYPRLNNRLTLLINKESMGALANRDYVTRNLCQPGDIVMDVDGDDALIGKQVLNMYNRLYHNNPDSWFVYSNMLQIEGKKEGNGRVITLDMNLAKAGPSGQIREQILRKNSYRTSLHDWCTSQLRSYLRDLYVKIPQTYFIDRDTGDYYIKASDRFVMYALVQLAGPKHTFYYEQYPYFYYQPNYVAMQQYECSFPIIQFYEAESRTATPFQPLRSLDDEIQMAQFYSIPLEIIHYHYEMQYRLLNCLKKATHFKVRH